MTPPVISQETKDENFQAIAPRKAEPILVRTTEQKTRMGGWGFLFFVLFVGASVLSYWFYSQNQALEKKFSDLQNVKNSEQEAVSTAGLSIVDRLNKHILLPQAQNAETITINNAQDLKKSDTFFEYAANGNLLVQFPNLEIIYDPSADVIINARTKNTGQVAGTEARALQGAITLEIRNGAGVAGLAGKTAQTFTGVKEYVVKAVGNAARSDFAQTIVINLSGKDISGLEKQFNVSAVTILPAGETTSDADVVIIVGKK